MGDVISYYEPTVGTRRTTVLEVDCDGRLSLKSGFVLGGETCCIQKVYCAKRCVVEREKGTCCEEEGKEESSGFVVLGSSRDINGTEGEGGLVLQGVEVAEVSLDQTKDINAASNASSKTIPHLSASSEPMVLTELPYEVFSPKLRLMSS